MKHIFSLIILFSAAQAFAEGKLARLLFEDCQGTDGKTASKVVLVYEVVHDDGFISQVKIPKTSTNIVADIKAKAISEESKKTVIDLK